MRTRLSKTVLNSSQRAHEEDAAWEFLEAVRDLFPKRFAELQELGSDPAYDNADDLGMRYSEAWNDLHDHVHEWTSKNRISCDAVDDVVTQIASGHQTFKLFTEVDVPIAEPPPIRARPFDQTREEFLREANEYFTKVHELYKQLGYKKAPVKRKPEHFRYLAANLIGGYSWAQIADGRNSLGLRAKSEKTVAGEARKAAHLVGIRLRNTPGPRPGTRLRKPVLRARR
jgi:hypothetical protein